MIVFQKYLQISLLLHIKYGIYCLDVNPTTLNSRKNGESIMLEVIPPRGLVLTPVDWQKEVAVPDMEKDPLIEIQELGSGWCREKFDEMVRRLFENVTYSKDYSVAVMRSKNPIHDRYYHQVRIWWELTANRTEQQLTLLDLLWEFQQREHSWYCNIGGAEGAIKSLGVPEPSAAFYESLWLNYGFMRVSGIIDGTWSESYRVWSYPHYTLA